MANLFGGSITWTRDGAAAQNENEFTLGLHGVYSEEGVLGSLSLLSGFGEADTLRGTLTWSMTESTFLNLYLVIRVYGDYEAEYVYEIYNPDDPPGAGSAVIDETVGNGTYQVDVTIEGGFGAPDPYQPIPGYGLMGSAAITGVPDGDPIGCFWDGKVMVVEDCGGDVDPPTGIVPDFVNTNPLASEVYLVLNADLLSLMCPLQDLGISYIDNENKLRLVEATVVTVDFGAYSCGYDVYVEDDALSIVPPTPINTFHNIGWMEGADASDYGLHESNLLEYAPGVSSLTEFGNAVLATIEFQVGYDSENETPIYAYRTGLFFL